MGIPRFIADDYTAFQSEGNGRAAVFSLCATQCCAAIAQQPDAAPVMAAEA